jgi:hypothetical protein
MGGGGGGDRREVIVIFLKSICLRGILGTGHRILSGIDYTLSRTYLDVSKRHGAFPSLTILLSATQHTSFLLTTTFPLLFSRLCGSGESV